MKYTVFPIILSEIALFYYCPARTGQTTSYRSGDDGDLQMGVPWPSPRFIDHGDGTVTDNLTGLMWTKNANLDHAGYNDWRLPNTRELHSLVDIGRSWPALPEGHPFTNVWSLNYWASSTRTYYTGDAWCIYMRTGDMEIGLKSDPCYVWSVRGGY